MKNENKTIATENSEYEKSNFLEYFDKRLAIYLKDIKLSREFSKELEKNFEATISADDARTRNSNPWNWRDFQNDNTAKIRATLLLNNLKKELNELMKKPEYREIFTDFQFATTGSGKNKINNFLESFLTAKDKQKLQSLKIDVSKNDLKVLLRRFCQEGGEISGKFAADITYEAEDERFLRLAHYTINSIHQFYVV